MSKLHLFAVACGLMAASVFADFTVGESISLTKDLEWQYRGKMTVAEGVTIDLNGHKLYVGEMAGPGTITNTAEGAPAELHVCVRGGYTYNNSSVAISGNLRLVKDGKGTFQTSKTGQSYTGGTEVTDGTLKAQFSTYPNNGITVRKGARLDTNPATSPAWNLPQGPFTLDGGDLFQGWQDMGSGWGQLNKLTLTADSSMTSSYTWGFIGGSYTKTSLDLGGHTLSIGIAAGKYFWLYNTDITAGTLKTTSGGYLEFDKTSVRADNATLDLNSALSIKANATFGNLIVRYGYNAGQNNATLFVKNRFKPVSNYIYNMQLLSGATIDLTDRTDTYSLKSTINSRVLAFANNAAITVDISGRPLEDGTRILSWESAPNATFTLDAESARAYTLNRDATGLTVTRRTDIAAKASWTGAGDVTDPTDPANWSCTDGEENAITAYPCVFTTIELGATTAFNIPVGRKFYCKEIVAADGTALSTDCDWRGIVKPTISCAIDLQGHKLLLSDIRGAGTVTDTTVAPADPGELHVDVPAGVTALNTDLTITGNVKVVKDGLGTFNPTKNSQTDYTGGTEVTAGLFKARRYRYREDNNVVVHEGARFDYDPYQNGSLWELPNGPYTLDGGDLYHDWQDLSTGWGQISRIILSSDSSFTSPRNGGMIGGGYAATTLDLGGHTLQVNVGNDGWHFFQLFNVDATKGTLRTGQWTSLHIDKTSFRGPEMTLDLEGVMEPAVTVTVSNVIVRTIATIAYGGGTTLVKGTFTPVSDWLHNFQLQNGATLDLNRRFDPFMLTSPLTGKTLGFAGSAAITVDVHEREFATGECLVRWNSRPSGITFTLDAETAETGKTLIVNDSGIYLKCPDDVEHAYWTGVVDNDLANAGNWACTNSQGTAVVDGLPMAATIVHFNGTLNFPTLANDSLVGAAIRIEDAVLAADADWTAPDNRFAFTGTLDLNGHSLSVARLAGEGTITNSTTDVAAPAELHVVVPANTTIGNSSVFITGNLKFFKDGAGTFTPTKTGNNYTGGTEIAGGTFKAWTCHYPGAYGIVVDSGAIYNFDGMNATYRNGDISGWITLNGGTMQNTTSDLTWGSFSKMKLTADSTLDAQCRMEFLAGGYNVVSLDLGGHTLSLNIPQNKVFMICNLVASSAGTIKTTGAGTLVFEHTGSNTPLASFDLGTALTQTTWVTLKDLTVRYTGNAKGGNEWCYVTGVYTPITDYINNFKLSTGATINLKGKSEAWSIDSATTSKTLAFANPAQITIDLEGREFTKEPTKVLTWTTRPTNVTFKPDNETKQKCYMSTRSDGVYVGLRSALAILIR